MNHHQPVRIITAVWLGLIAVNALGATRYVDLNCANATAPYTSWETAATNIQQAVNISGGIDLILVTNGVYQTGSSVNSGANRVNIFNAIKVQSVNGPDQTVIEGFQVPGTTNGSAAIRCVYLTSGATLSGFTLTNGATLSGESGGGVKCQSTSAVVTNCILIGNAAANLGGGANSGKLINCSLIGNRSGWGGGTFGSVLNGCTLRENISSYRGGGAANGPLTNCVLTGNLAAAFGGGCDGATVVNCTIVGNRAHESGGGVDGGAVINSIVYYNTIELNTSSGTNINNNSLVTNSCTTPLPSFFGVNNFTNPPLFADQAGGNLRLQPASLCRNAGTNVSFLPAIDKDGRPRIVESRVDVGAYEFQGTNINQFIGWLLTNNLPTDVSSDYADPDSDGANNWQEWVAGTTPTDTASVLRLLSTSTGAIGVDVTWSSINGKSYWLERATDLSVFSLVESNLVGQPISTAFSDTTATNASSYFYRVGVQ